MKDIREFIVCQSDSIRSAIKKMDAFNTNFIVVTNSQEEVVGVMTDGDFRHAVHTGIQLDEAVTSIVNRDFYFVKKNYI